MATKQQQTWQELEQRGAPYTPEELRVLWNRPGGSDSSGTLIVGKPGVFGAARRPSTPYAATKLPRVAPMTVAESPATIATADNANYMYLNRPQTTDNALPNST